MTTRLQTIRTRTMTRWLPASAILAFSALWIFAAEAQAQVGIGVEARAGATFPQGDLSDAGAEAGLSFGAELHVNFQRNLTAYAGFHRHAFNCDDGCTLGDDPRSTGVAAGLKYIIHAPGDALAWARGGVVANTFESSLGSSDREIGFELGVGADMPIGARLYLVPNIGFISHSTGNSVKANFFTLGLGAHVHLR